MRGATGGYSLANEELFGPIAAGGRPSAKMRQTRWSKTEVRLPNGATLYVRAYRTSTRGLPPSDRGSKNALEWELEISEPENRERVARLTLAGQGCRYLDQPCLTMVPSSPQWSK
jgi:hypothetical protein